jgi:uncharacterized repeat protein (TIGR01451 family)
MASFIGRLFSRFKRKQSEARRSRSNRVRQLRLEPMEARRLLAADFGSIGGNVFTDLTDNGLTIDDIGRSAVTVWIYRDGAGTPGVGTFESGGGVAGGNDVLVGSQVTDANGDFLFQDLEAGRYFIEQAPIAGQIQRTAETVKTVDISIAQSGGIGVLTIDNFTDVSLPLVANSGTPTVSSSTFTTPGNAVGGERDILVNHTAGPNNIEVQVAGALLSINPGAGTSGNVVLTYDGVDGDATSIDHTNLNIDLLASSAQAFQFLAGSQAGNSMTVDVYSGVGNFSTLTVPLPVTPGAVPTETMILRFADFVVGGGTGADFSSVTALQILVDAALSADAQIDLTQTVAPFLSTQNFANLNPLSIGNQVWRDLNNNGLLDAGEAGLSGVLLELYEDTNGNGVFDSGVDTLVGSTNTDANGIYSFGDLFPGDYLAVIPLSNFGVGQPLAGHTASTGLSPVPAPNTNIDDDNNGVFLAGVGVVTNGVLTLTAGGEPDGADNNENLRLDFGFVPQMDLAVTKTANVSSVAAGSQVTYTLEVTNNGPATAEEVLVVDNLPDFLTIISVEAEPDGTVNLTGDPLGEIEVTYPSLAAGASRTIVIVASIPAGQAAAASVVNTAVVSGLGIDLDATNDSDSADIEITRNAVLEITKTDTPDPTGVGQPLNYQIVVTNSGPSTATNLVILDTLPAGLVFVDVNSTSGIAEHTAGQITVTVPTLAVGQQVTVDIATTVLASFVGSLIANTATADADEALPVSAETNTTINPEVDLAITKTGDINPVNRGGTLIYTLVVANNGPGLATDVEVVDTLPAGVTFVSATGGTVTPPGPGDSEVIVNVGNIPAGEERTVTITVQVTQAAGATLTNSAIVRSPETLAGFDSNPANNSDNEVTNTQSTIDLAVTKTDSSGGNPVAPGQTLTYTILVTNTGPSNASGVRVTDNIPDGIRITQATSNTAGVQITVPPSAEDNNPVNNDDLLFVIGDLAVGQTVELTVEALVFAATRGNLVNTAVVSTTNASLIENDTTNNTSTITTALVPQIDLAVTKVDTIGGTVVAGGALTYHIDVTNSGPSTATGVTLTDPLPAGLTFTSVSSQQGTASHAGGVVTAQIGTMEPGATVRITVNATVNPDARGTLTNTATASGTENDINPGNNAGTSNTTINPQIDLSVVKSKVNPNDPAVAGEPLTYTILVTNQGPSTATSVVMTDVLPNGITLTNGSSTVGNVTNTGQTVTANIGTLAPGASATVTLLTSVAASAAGDFSNTASVNGTETDINPANNSSTLVTPVAVRGSIAGVTYVDRNRNGIFDAADDVLAGVTKTLTGTDLLGTAVSLTTTTDAQGQYQFADLLPGTYTVMQTQPFGFQSFSVNVGVPSGGTAGDNQISDIVLTSGVSATNYNFGEVPNPLSKRRFLASSSEFD